MNKIIKTIYVYPPTRGPGGHVHYYMAYYEGEELLSEAERAWGHTSMDAEQELKIRTLKQEERGL